jgi:ADP-ribose pyrophosphatase YjhB (NUDIX family)
MNDSKDNPQPSIATVDGQRRFACSPVAVLAFILNDREEILLMSPPDLPGHWQVITGAMEADETVLQGVLREVREEAGSDIQVRPLGTVHVSAFHYDERVRFMLSIGYLLAYEGGEVQPGDDMTGSKYRWWSLAELSSPEMKLIVPPGEKWLVERAVKLYRLWNTYDGPVRSGFDLSVRGKTKK